MNTVIHYSRRFRKRRHAAGICTAAVLLLVLPPAIRAQPASLLSRYITRALQHNPELAAARAQTEAAREAITATRTLPDPELSFNKGFGSAAWHYELAVAQRIPWPGSITARGDAAAFTAQAAEAHLNDLTNDILMKLRNTYAELYALHEKIRLLQRNVSFLEQAEAVTAAAYTAGSRTQMAVLKLQLERTDAVDRILSLQSDAAGLRERMGALLDLPADSIEVPAELPEMPVPDYEYAVAISLEQNPAVAALQLGISAAEQKRTAARLGLVPDLMVGTKYEPEPAGSGTWHLLTGISIPLWLPAKLADIRMHQAQTQAAREKLRAEQAALRAEAGSLHRSYTDAVRRIALLDTELIPLAEQSLAATEAHYRTGTADVTGLLDALRTLVTLQVRKTGLEAQREKLAADIVLCCLGRAF